MSRLAISSRTVRARGIGGSMMPNRVKRAMFGSRILSSTLSLGASPSAVLSPGTKQIPCRTRAAMLAAADVRDPAA